MRTRASIILTALMSVGSFWVNRKDTSVLGASPGMCLTHLLRAIELLGTEWLKTPPQTEIVPFSLLDSQKGSPQEPSH